MGRLLIVSNRLPVTVAYESELVDVRPSVGGLATGLASPHAQSGGVWFGWPGDVSQWPAHAVQHLNERLRAARIEPVHLGRGEIRRYYESFSNRVLWPLFHWMIDRIPPNTTDWETYQRVNERFADAVSAAWRPGDPIWVHDYQLLLVPRLLRDRLPDARIGFFLHVPFPGSEVFRALPWRDEILRGMLGADLIGFHTHAYVRHFRNAAFRRLGIPPDGDHVEVDGRRVGVAAFPMGVDAAAFDAPEVASDVALEVDRIRQPGVKLLLGIDRLDYTKGLRRRLQAIGRMLETRPDLRGRVRYLQVAVPSRENVHEYERHRAEVEALIGRINGAWSTVDAAPIRYLYRSFAQHELVRLYRAADVMLVTPLRDGMNLVAKEFVASRTDEAGALVLSEFAGAADELPEACIVNPYDVDGLADAIAAAIEMPEDEQRRRMRAMRSTVLRDDVHGWASRFLSALDDDPPQAERDHRRLVEVLRPATTRVWVLDYDGTLMPLAGHPRDAAPDEALLALLEALAAQDLVHVVSGRDRSTLEDWLGHLPIALHAEHGFWSRARGSDRWEAAAEVPHPWLDRARVVLDEFARRTPGAFVEAKAAALAWHHRRVDPDCGSARARELLDHLLEELVDSPLEALSGDHVVEVRVRGANKGRAVSLAARAAGPQATLIAIGDDRTDEDAFAALGPGDICVKVGSGRTGAAHRLASIVEVRRLLGAFVTATASV